MGSGGGGAGGGNAQSANQTSANRSFGVGSFGGPIGGYSASGWGPTMSTGVGGHFWNGTNPGFAHASGISKNGGIIRNSSSSVHPGNINRAPNSYTHPNAVQIDVARSILANPSAYPASTVQNAGRIMGTVSGTSALGVTPPGYAYTSRNISPGYRSPGPRAMGPANDSRSMPSFGGSTPAGHPGVSSGAPSSPQSGPSTRGGNSPHSQSRRSI